MENTQIINSSELNELMKECNSLCIKIDFGASMPISAVITFIKKSIEDVRAEYENKLKSYCETVQEVFKMNDIKIHYIYEDYHYMIYFSSKFIGDPCLIKYVIDLKLSIFGSVDYIKLCERRQ